MPDQRSSRRAFTLWLQENAIGLLIAGLLGLLCFIGKGWSSRLDTISRTMDDHSIALAKMLERTSNLNTMESQEREDRKAADAVLQQELDDITGVHHARH